jgi:hypothetical protein
MWKYVLVIAVVNKNTVLGHVALCNIEKSFSNVSEKTDASVFRVEQWKRGMHQVVQKRRSVYSKLHGITQNKTIFFSYWRNLLSLNFVRRLVFNGALRFGSRFCFHFQVQKGTLCGRSHWVLYNTKLDKTRTWYQVLSRCGNRKWLLK